MINALELYKNIKSEWDKTSQPLARRGIPGSEDLTNQGLLGMFSVPALANAIAPVGTYEDGSTGLAWPQLLAAPAEGMANFGRYGYDSPEAIRDNAISAFDVAGGAVTGGLGVGLAGGMADNAVGSAGGKLTQGIRNAATVGRVNPDTLAISPDPSLNSTWKNTVEAGNILFGTDETYMPAILNEAGDFPLDAYDIGGLSNAWRNKVRTTGELFSNAPSGSSVPLAMNALERSQPQGIRAYHGSPHDFARFSLDKIGTGEGAQAYGHGLYFADNEAVARSYRDNLSPTNAAPMTPESTAQLVLQNAGNDFDQASAILGQMTKTANPETRAMFQDAQKILEQQAAVGQPFPSAGRMYEVNIKANPEDFLDWDKPLSQQSEAVRNALSPLIESARKSYPTLDEQALTGQGALKAYSGHRGNNSDAASRALREAGIPGIRYLDGMSRGAGEGSSNYVVFDDQLVDILRKYANAPTGAAVPLAGETQDTDTALLEYLKAIGLY